VPGEWLEACDDQRILNILGLFKIKKNEPGSSFGLPPEFPGSRLFFCLV
jgi:hypothetical protein